jgi:hypothetical protein
MKTAADEAHNLTGVWHGLYTYPGGESVPFVATLIDAGASLSGSTYETCATLDRARSTLFAMLWGVRSGRSVNFTKNYDGSAGWTHSVAYDGALNADATEIEGDWTIDHALSGRFLMIRAPGREAVVERRVAETV